MFALAISFAWVHISHATPAQSLRAIEKEQALEGGLDFLKGQLTGDQGLLFREFQNPNPETNRPLKVYVDIQRDPLVQLAVPEGWQFCQRDPIGLFYLFCDSITRPRQLLVLNRKSATVLLTELPQAFRENPLNPARFFIDTKNSRLFALSSQSIIATSFQNKQWQTIFDVKNTRALPPTLNLETLSSTLSIEALNEQSALAIVGERMIIKLVQRSSRDLFNLFVLEIQLNSHQQTLLRFHQGINSKHPMIRNAGFLLHDRYLLLLEADSRSLTHLDMQTGAKTVTWNLTMDVVTNPIDLTDGRTLLLEPMTNRLLVLTADGTDASNGNPPLLIDLPSLPGRVYHQILRLDEHQFLIHSRAISPTRKEPSLIEPNRLASNSESAVPHHLEGVFDLRNQHYYDFPEIIKSLDIRASTINNKGQILFSLYSEDDSTTDSLVRLTLPPKGADSFFGTTPLSAPKVFENPVRPEHFLTLIAQREKSFANLEENNEALANLNLPSPQHGRFLLDSLMGKIKRSDPLLASQLWSQYQPLLFSYFLGVTEPQKEEVLEKLAVTMTESLRRESNFTTIPASKLANTLLSRLKLLFGINTEPRRDFFLEAITNSHLATPYIIASEPFEILRDPLAKSSFYFGIQITQAGFIFTYPDSTPFSFELQTKESTVTVAGNARSTTKNLSQKGQASLPYAKLRNDGRLTGVFVVSPNLNIPFEGLIRKIFQYYTSKGFLFGMPTLRSPEDNKGLQDWLSRSYLFPRSPYRVSDGKAWLKEKLASGEIDYLFKESHSAGSDTVLELAKSNYLLVGRKPGLLGYTEMVYILYPSQQDSNGDVTDFLSSSELNEWLVERKKKNGAEFVFVNSSCWSTSKAVQELTHDTSGLLIEIPTFELIPTFSNKIDNPERNLLESLRQEKDYQSMREAMKTLKKSPFILPNEPQYDRDIWQQLQGGALEYQFEFKTSDRSHTDGYQW